MRIYASLLSILIFLALSAPGQTTGGESSVLKEKIDRLIQQSGAEVVGLAMYDLETSQSLLIQDRVSLHAASTMKLPVMMELFRLVEAKKLSLREPILIKNSFSSIIDGSLYRLNRTDDSDEELYHRIGQSAPLIELIEHMITMSSNLATNLLIEIAKPEQVSALMRELGAKEIQVLRGVEDSKAFAAGRNNTTTAYDLMILLRALAEQKFLNRKSCEKIVSILAAQHFNDGIPAGVPSGVKVAHKTGDITAHNHDAAIVFPPGRKPYVLVVLTKGLKDHRRSSQLIAEVSREIYQFLSH